MVSIVIPIYNAEAYLPDLLNSLSYQTIDHELIIVDSSSTDHTHTILKEHNITYHVIPTTSFNHGTTRNLAVELTSHEIVVMLTQDAIPAKPTAIEQLVNMLMSRPDIGMAYGRQLPYTHAGMLSRFARETNYPAKSRMKAWNDIPELGIKTCHCSNSFAAYRKSALLSVGGFPEDTILGEDVVVAARMITNGLSLAYCADAQVYHSHDYTIGDEFKRYFDIGAFHQQQRLLLSPFTRAESEGIKYVLDEWRYLIKHKQSMLIPSQLLRTIAKYAGYRLGRGNHRLPLRMKRFFSMHRSFWG